MNVAPGGRPEHKVAPVVQGASAASRFCASAMADRRSESATASRSASVMIRMGFCGVTGVIRSMPGILPDPGGLSVVPGTLLGWLAAPEFACQHTFSRFAGQRANIPQVGVVRPVANLREAHAAEHPGKQAVGTL